jgi:hypothetical protein
VTEPRKTWKVGPIKKFGDVAPVEERMKRELPPINRWTPQPTAEIEMRREVDETFRIKRTQ